MVKKVFEKSSASPEILQKLFVELAAKISVFCKSTDHRIGTVKLLDSTTMSLCLNTYKWATYVFDRGYVDYRKYDQYCMEGSFILRNRMAMIGKGAKQMKQVLRLIETTDLKGNLIQIVTNRFDLTAEEIGQLYRNRLESNSDWPDRLLPTALNEVRLHVCQQYCSKY